MILYFDNYITDLPFGKPKVPKDNFRNGVPIYHMPSRLAISKYVLASYSVYPWSDVLIKYQIDDPAEDKEFEDFAKSLFPKAVIIKNRSATQAEYKKSLVILERMQDDWIFYAPNNDHPLLLTTLEQVGYINNLLKKAEKYKNQYQFFSLPYSMFSEYLNAFRPGSLNFGVFGKQVKVLEEDKDAIVVLVKDGDFNSVSVMNKGLFRHFFTSAELNDSRVIRLEDLKGPVKIKDEVVIIPKIELAAHFEGYEHMLGGRYEIQLDQIPSLLIPPGFFENNIRLAYGYHDYRPGWVNINPAAKAYSFRDPEHGADLKIGLEDLPLFWKSRISKIDINPQADQAALEKGRLRHWQIVRYPWSLKNQGWNFKTLRFWIKRPLIRLYPFLEKLGLMPFVKKISRAAGFY